MEKRAYFIKVIYTVAYIWENMFYYAYLMYCLNLILIPINKMHYYIQLLIPYISYTGVKQYSHYYNEITSV